MSLDDWTPPIFLLGSIVVLTSVIAIIIRRRFKGRRITVAVAYILGIFAGIGGASHGPGEILQGNIAPKGIIIEAWPELASFGGEPAMTLIPSFSLSGIVTVFLGFAVTIWAVTRIESKNGPLVLILLSIMMLLVGGGLLPPAFGVAAGIISTIAIQKNLKTSHQKV